MYKNFFVTILILSLISCGTKKNIVYLQNVNSGDILDFPFVEYKIKVDDILKIDISSENPQIDIMIDPLKSNNNATVNKTGLLYNGYQVDFNGNIYMPALGEIKVLDKTVFEIKNNIESKYISEGIFNQITVDVKILNSDFTILGEVNNPGKYDFLKNNLSILEAIGIAGDLTINGKRNDIKIIRTLNSENIVYTVDITNKDFINSSFFQVFPGDIIIVNPNSTKIKTAGVIGNSGTLLSLLSFVLSSIIVISNSNN